MPLFLGAFSFFWHAIDRYSFRPNNEALRKAILDPVVFSISKGLAEMMSKKGTKTTTEAVVAAVQPLSLRYAPAQKLISKDDPNSALWLAVHAIIADTELQLTETERNVLGMIVWTKLAEGTIKLDLPKRIQTLETLL